MTRRLAAVTHLSRVGRPRSAKGSTGHQLGPARRSPFAQRRSGLPLGIQIVGRFGRDRAALEAALFVEQAIVKKTGG